MEVCDDTGKSHLRLRKGTWFFNCQNLNHRNQACDLSGFFTNLPLPQNLLERTEVATKEGKKEVACIVSKPLVSCLWGCGESVNPPKIKHPGGSVFPPLEQREIHVPLLIFQDVLLLSSHTPWEHHFSREALSPFSLIQSIWSLFWSWQISSFYCQKP